MRLAGTTVAIMRPSKRSDKGPELRLGAWFLSRGVWAFLAA